MPIHIHGSFIVVICMALAGCETMSKQQMGTGVGAIAGGILGTQIGGGTGKIIATVGGAALGGLLGSQLGKYLDTQDKSKADAASRQALETGRTQTWTNPETGVRGTVQVVNTPNRSKPVAAGTPARQCRTTKHDIVLKDGSTRTEDVTACKGPNGWEAV